MRTVIALSYSLLLLFILTNAQSTTPNVNKVTSEKNNVKEEIEKITEENFKNIDEILELRKENEKDIENLEKLNDRKKKLIERVSLKVSKIPVNRNLNTTVKVVYTKDKIPYKVIDLNNIKTDSTCVETSRGGMFSKRKCIKWEYYKSIDDLDEDKVIIKK